MKRVELVGSHLETDQPKPWLTEGREATMERVWAFLSYRTDDSEDYTSFLMSSLKSVNASAAEGKTTFEFTVKRQHSNSFGTIHGGVIASLVDLGGMAAIVALTNHPFGVSVDVAVTYIGPAKEGETIRIESVCHKASKSVAFTTTMLYVGERLIAKGNHTKFNNMTR
ncbi:HotDog domain-containing protein [Cladochytrium replicatum]|nr:HotDog domain-containing protein [Cladochytrium replicatum]